MLPRPARYVPHIYTDQELAALFAQTDRCRYDSQVPFRHLVMPVLFRTIYACGLRASEARLLRLGDVDIGAGVLQIRDAKGGKDRQVPVSGPLRARLAGYRAQVAGQPGGDWFFPGRHGLPLTLGNIYKNFRRFLWQARIPHGGPGPRPPRPRPAPLGGRLGYAPCRGVSAARGGGARVVVRIISLRRMLASAKSHLVRSFG